MTSEKCDVKRNVAIFVTMAVKKSKKAVKPIAQPKMLRKNRVVISLNDKEMAVLNRYYTKYKITNKTKWLRETIIIAVLKQFEADAPTLFTEEEMRQ